MLIFKFNPVFQWRFVPPREEHFLAKFLGVEGGSNPPSIPAQCMIVLL